MIGQWNLICFQMDKWLVEETLASRFPTIFHIALELELETMDEYRA